MERCGHCEHWMKKSDCPKEKTGLKPTSKSIPCDKFLLANWVKENK